MFPAATSQPAASTTTSGVVLRNSRRPEPRHRFEAVWNRGQLRGGIDYYGALTGGLGGLSFLPALREAASVIVAHNPFLIESAPEPCPAVVLLPTADRLLAMRLQKNARSQSNNSDKATNSNDGDARPFASLQAEAALDGLNVRRHFYDRLTRRGALIAGQQSCGHAYNAFELHIHERFATPGDALAHLRSLGHYLPAVFYGDTMHFGEDVVEAFATGRVAIDASHGATDRHLKSILRLWHMGFDLVLPDVHPSQLRTMRTKHGRTEALLIGQRLVVEYRHVDGAVATVESVRLEAPDESALSWGASAKAAAGADPDAEAIDGLLRGAEDFPQVVAVNGDSPRARDLLKTLPALSEGAVAKRFDTLLAEVENWAAASRQQQQQQQSGTKAGADAKPPPLHELMERVQRVCVLDDVAGTFATRLGELQPAMVAADVRAMASDASVTTRESAKRIDAATEAYVAAAEATLRQLLAAARAKAVAQHRKLADSPATKIRQTLPADDTVPAHLPFFDNVLPRRE